MSKKQVLIITLLFVPFILFFFEKVHLNQSDIDEMQKFEKKKVFATQDSSNKTQIKQVSNQKDQNELVDNVEKFIHKFAKNKKTDTKKKKILDNERIQFCKKVIYGNYEETLIYILNNLKEVEEFKYMILKDFLSKNSFYSRIKDLNLTKALTKEIMAFIEFQSPTFKSIINYSIFEMISKKIDTQEFDTSKSLKDNLDNKD